MRVTADTFEYADWPSRKPSRKKLQRESLKRDPIGTLAQVGTLAGKRAVERAGERAGRSVLRTLGVSGASVATLAKGATAALGTAAAAAAILAAGYVVSDKIARTQRVKLGDRLNAISSRFVVTQRELEKHYGTTKWEGVPADVRARAVREYKAAIATATAQAQGSAIIGVRESYK